MTRRWWALAAVLAIFAMHGLASHAGAHDRMATSTSTGTHTSHSAHAAHAAPAGTPVAGVAMTVAGAHGEPDHHRAAFVLCLVVLATSAILLLLRHGRPRSGLLDLLPRAVTTSSYAVATRRWTPPPDLHALSVMRC